MKLKKIKRFELIFVNRLCEDYVIYFDDLVDILNYVDNFNKNILYVKSLYDYKKHEYIYNICKFSHNLIKEEDKI